MEDMKKTMVWKEIFQFALYTVIYGNKNAYFEDHNEAQ